MGQGRGGADRVDVVVCRGCCCGTDKHPDVDHEAQLAEVRAAAETLPGTRVLVADCLNRCDFSNVVAVRHRPAEGKPRDVWLGGVLERTDTAALCAFVAELADPARVRDRQVPLPATLERRRIASPAEARQALRELVAAAGARPTER